MSDRGSGDEHRRDWMLAVALLAGGTGICLGSVLAGVVVGAAIAPLVWVMLAGRVLGTIGVVFAWSRLEARPTIVRVLGGRIGRAWIGRRTERANPVGSPTNRSGGRASNADRWIQRLLGAREIRRASGSFVRSPRSRPVGAHDRPSASAIARGRSRPGTRREPPNRSRIRGRSRDRPSNRHRTAAEPIAERVRTLVSRTPLLGAR